MSKAESIDALLDSAINVFAERGYDGASLRDIAAMANKPLSMIHTYFGSKADLYTIVRERVWKEIAQERDQLLQQALSREDGPVSLRAIIYALVYPVASRALSGSMHNLCEARLLIGGTQAQIEQAAAIHGQWTHKWIDAIMLAGPGLSHVKAVWLYSFVVGSLYSYQMLHHYYDPLLDGDEDLAADDIVDMLVTFAASGIGGATQHQAMADMQNGFSAPPGPMLALN